MQRVSSVALESARKYGKIDRNPARDKLTKFSKDEVKPPPYTVEEMQKLLMHAEGTEYEMPVVLAGLYGLRLGEVLGLRWRNVDMQKGIITVSEQLPFKLPKGTKTIAEFAPLKSKTAGFKREFPLSDESRRYFIRQMELQERQISLCESQGMQYYDNDLVVAQADGAPFDKENFSKRFPHFIASKELPRLRYHDLRATAATNMFNLSGDFYTVGAILGHSLKGISNTLGIGSNAQSVTERYVSANMEAKRAVIGNYHAELFPQKRQRKRQQGKIISL
ncbi:tyrosine-type recombinase/integrase [Oscillospiraceae bacterium OttesenSCG-928-F05]|nr:tyrosine-type recombinase/integrase [Oscillospiraceae bacterium OttesenSCG-928-F05]